MQYLAIVAKTHDNYVGFFADPIPAIATAESREALIAKLSELLTSAMLGTSRHVKPSAKTVEDADPRALEGYESVEAVWVDLGYINPIAQDIWDAIVKAKIRPAELARRMGISQTAVSKLIDPSRTSPYNLDTLQRIASALGMNLEPPRFVAVSELVGTD